MIENSIIQTAEITKVFIADNVTEIINAINEGGVDPLKLKLQAKAIEEILKQIKPILDKAAREKAESFGAKQFTTMGADIKLIEAGTKYDFSNCNDLIYFELMEEFKKLDAKIKKRETILKAIDEKEEFYRSETGETWTAYPPIKKSTSTIEISIK